MEKYNLNENLSDLQTLSENWSSYPVSNYNCSRPGAFFPWPRNITGKETWFNSTALHRHIPIIRFNPFSRDLDNYKNDDDEYKKYLYRVNELTEYQDKYLAHTPSLRKQIK
uniref:Uncharacterized protein n=1 Tax=Schistosoma mansoni TaxID=6183 RepID=A0A5K4ENW6_SCHMA